MMMQLYFPYLGESFSSASGRVWKIQIRWSITSIVSLSVLVCQSLQLCYKTARVEENTFYDPWTSSNQFYDVAEFNINVAYIIRQYKRVLCFKGD